MNKFIIFKRPVITVFLFYAAFLVLLNGIGVFEPQKQSFLIQFTKYKKPVTIEGKVISDPELVKNGQRFILKAGRINDFFAAGEKILVNSPAGYKISYGDIINIEGRISKPKEADFPLIFDYRQYLARLGIYTMFNVSSFEYIESKPNPVIKFSLWLQRDVVKKIDAYFKQAYAGVLKPVIIGDKSSLDQQTKDNFTDAGLMHILVVSGLNVGFVGAMFLIIFKICGLSLKKASLLTIPFVFLYALATGANPPVVRAAIMFSSVLIALSLNREPLIYNSLALSALLILIFQPQQLFTASFQMSYAATIGIVYFYKDIFSLFKKIKNKFIKALCGVFAVTAAAQIPIIPVCMYYFGKISLISFISNVIVVPLIGIITPLGFIFYFCTFIFSYAAAVFSVVISIMLHFILVVVNLSAGFGFSVVSVAKPSLTQLVFFFLFLFCITYFKDKRRFLFSAVCLALSLSCVVIPKIQAKNRVTFNIYDGQNITAVQISGNDPGTFMLYQKSDRYDKYYIDSFMRFLSFSGRMKSKVSFIGFNEKDVLTQIKGKTLIFVEGQKPEVLDINFNDNTIYLDMTEGTVYINDEIKMKIKDNPSFYYYHKSGKFKIKKPRVS